jgi:hypothetical protein
MLILRQNSYAPRGKQRTGRREAQSREPVNKVKNKLCVYEGYVQSSTKYTDRNRRDTYYITIFPKWIRKSTKDLSQFTDLDSNCLRLKRMSEMLCVIVIVWCSLR